MTSSLSETWGVFSLCQLARVQRIERRGDAAHFELVLADGETRCVLDFDGVTRVDLLPADGGPVIEDPAALTALELQLLHNVLLPEPHVLAFA